MRAERPSSAARRCARCETRYPARRANARERAHTTQRVSRELRRSKRSRRSRSFRFFVVHEAWATMRLAPMLSAILDSMHENGQAIAEYRQQRAERHRDRAHRPNVHPHRHLKRGGRRRRHGSAESRDHAHRDQKRRRSDRKPFDPRRKPLQIFVQVEHVRGALIDPIPEHRRQDESDDVDEGSLDRSEDRPVHHGERIGHGERRGRDDRKDGDRERNREQSDRPDRGFNLRLISDDQEGQQERARQKAEGAEAPENPAQTGETMLLRVVITVLCGVGLYASLFMLAKTRRAELGLLEEPSVVQRPAARLYGGVPNALLGGLYYPALAIAVWFGHGHVVSVIVLTIVAFAAITSAALAYSL